MILGLDPGRDKTGWALVRMDGGLVLSGITPTAERESLFSFFDQPAVVWEKFPAVWTRERLSAVDGTERVKLVAVGDGTGGGEVIAAAEARGWRAFFVDERGTTLEARGLYWQLHCPSLWQRLLPRGLRVPPRPLDDLAAWAVALRFIGALPPGVFL